MKLHAIKVLDGDFLLASLRVPVALGGLSSALLDLIDNLLLIPLEDAIPKLEVFLIAFEGRVASAVRAKLGVACLI